MTSPASALARAGVDNPDTATRDVAAATTETVRTQLRRRAVPVAGRNLDVLGKVYEPLAAWKGCDPGPPRRPEPRD
jgi:hypothetical protein